MKVNSKIDRLKKEAKKHFTEYYGIASNYNCGLFLAECISPDLVYHKTEFNKIMDELAKIDPSVPTARL